MSDWITSTGREANSSNIATPAQTGPRYEWGQGGIEIVAGHSMTRSTGHEVSSAPIADASSGLVFMTEAGFPVPATGPRMTDLVVINGMPTKVANAVRLGLIADPAKGQPQSAPPSPIQAQRVVPQLTPQAAPDASPAASQTLADTFTAEVLPKVSPMARDGLLKGIAEGQFSELTLDYLQLEGAMPLSEIAATRDAYAAKVTAATGMDEGELEELFNTDRAGFTKAAQSLLTTGSTADFQALAQRSVAASYVPLSTEDALSAWRSADFPQALVDAGLEPTFEGGQVCITIPGRGTVTWQDAVQRGLVRVSRA